MSTSGAQTLITPLPRQLISTCDVPALSTWLTTWLHGTLQRSALPRLPIYTSNTPASPQRSSSLDPRLPPFALHRQAVHRRVLSNADSGAPHEGLRAGRGLSLVDGQPQAWAGSGSAEVRPTKEARAGPATPAPLAPLPRPRPPRPHRAAPARAAASRAFSASCARAARAAPLPTASCFSAPAPAASPPQPRPSADAPRIGLRAGPPGRRLRAQPLALIGGSRGAGRSEGAPVKSKLPNWAAPPRVRRGFGALRTLCWVELRRAASSPSSPSLWHRARIPSWTQLWNHGRTTPDLDSGTRLGPYVGLGGTLALGRVSAYSLALASRAARVLGGALDFKLAGLFWHSYSWSDSP